MKKNFLNITNKVALLLGGMALTVSCNDYLDKMPDNRTKLDTPDKITQILVSAYPYLPVNMQELMSDNVDDYGHTVDAGEPSYEEAYRFRDITSVSFDSPSVVWEQNYNAIAAANHALEAIEHYEGSEDLSPQRGEALVCRAFAHFVLCNTFCQAYNPQSSSSDLGVPYVTETENEVFVERERGTVANVYDKIEKDLEEGIPLIDDNIYSQPKYHFTKKAAYAFAAQFYLYYGKYDKAIQSANMAIGEDPTALFRNWELFTGTSSVEYANAYCNTDEAANIFNIGFESLHFRFLPQRYIHTFQLTKEVESSNGPWGAELDSYGILYQYAERSYFFPKIVEYFMYSDVAAQIGSPYIVNVKYNTEKTVIDRAEAYALSGNYEMAARDLNYFYRQAGADTSLSADEIAEWYEEAGPLYKKELAPRFPLEEGIQTNLVHACLHARRIAAVMEGTRLEDLKRYGIAYTHNVDGAPNIEIEPYDKRLAIQLPNTVTAAGLERNPR